MLVFAFDRDWTVDVNPHPHHEAVPLEWVRHLAHETDHAVYAIGNQNLADEAAIPGVVDIVGRHPDHWDEWLGSKQPDGYYEFFPKRRERLALIEDLHPEADRYIVVDDLDLSDVDSWEHYHAWEFVPEVEAGTVDAALPWTYDQEGDDNLVTDGGVPNPAGIMPADAADLASFVEEYGDTPGFEVNYEVDGEDVTRLCWELTVVEGAPEHGDDKPFVLCSPLEPDGETFVVTMDALGVVHTAMLSPEDVTARAETPAKTAAVLRRLAEEAPSQMRLSPVLELLDQKSVSPQQQRDALGALAAFAAVRPDACTPAIPILRSLLQYDDPVAPQDALGTLHAIAQSSPEDIAPARDAIEPYLDSDDAPVQREAAGCLAEIATEYPEDIRDAVPPLVEFLAVDDDRRRYAVRALSRVAADSPDAIVPAIDQLAAIASDDAASDGVRISAMAALGRTLSASTGRALDVFEDIVKVYEADNYKLRNNAVALTYEMADLHTDLVAEYVDAITPLLTDDDNRTRINASGTLSRVAEDFPEPVSHLTPTFIDLLTDDDEQVRENACWALGRLRATEAKAPLEERLHEEPNEAVRNQIAWALSEIDPI